ncbi:hypothetical protein ACTMTI_44155 [Nonomuraea sp. H19]|uniref:hypothetical protein n=1 Tax=Nonomuraea sp. H19 TaxID=3452206 RepID=UPI003F88E651
MPPPTVRPLGAVIDMVVGAAMYRVLIPTPPAAGGHASSATPTACFGERDVSAEDVPR